MKQIAILFLIIAASFQSMAQSIVPLRGDTIRIYKQGGNAELIIENATRARTGAFLKNSWNGRTEYAYAVDTAYLNATLDSIVFVRGNTSFALPVATGEGGGADGNNYVNGLELDGDSLRVQRSGLLPLSVYLPFSEKLDAGDTILMLDPYKHWEAGYVHQSRTITINGVTQDLSDDREWTVAGGGGSDTLVTTKDIPVSAFQNRMNLTVAEAEKYIRTNFGSDTLGTFRIVPDTMRANEHREIQPGLLNYEAFPIITRSPVTGTMIITYQLSKSHAGNSAAAYIRSTDNARTWSNRKFMAERVTGSDYKAAAVGVRPSDNRWFAFYDNGIGNTLGLNPRIANMKISTDDALTFGSPTTIDLTAEFGYRATISSHTMYLSKAGTQFVPVYGLDAVGDKFEAGYIRSTDWFATWTFYFYPQDSSIHKFNESTILETQDTMFVFIRSENLSGPYLWRAYSLDDGLTWSTPVGVTYSGRMTRPNVVVLPDKRMFLVQRENGGTQRGIIYVSSNNGLSFTNAGFLYPENKPFMYGSPIVIGDQILVAYSLETGTALPFASSTAGIHLATFPANNTGFVYKDSARATLVKPAGHALSVTQRYRGFEAGEFNVSSTPEKPVFVRSDSTSHVAGDENDALFLGGDLKNNTGASVIREMVHTGVRNAPFSTSQNQSVVAWSDTIARMDSVPITGRFASAVAANGHIYFAPNLGGGTDVIKYNPITGFKKAISVTTNTTYRGSVVVGRYVYLIPNGTSTAKKIDVYTDAVTNVTLPSNGWIGANYSGGFIWSSKAASNQILKLDPKTDTYTVLTTPSTGSWAAGIFDGRYQWFIGSSTNFWLKLDVTNDQITEMHKSLPLTGIGGTRQSAVFDGTLIWAGDDVGNTIFVTNPNTGAVRTITLPTGSYPYLLFDGVSIWAINRTAADLVKINPKTYTYKVIKDPDAGATNKWYGGVLYNNRIFLVPDQTGQIGIITTAELGGDKYKDVYDSAKLFWPEPNISVGRSTNNIYISDSLDLNTSYLNPGGRGDRTDSVTITTDLSMVGAVTVLIDGVTSGATNYFNAQTTAGKYIQWDFATPRYLTEAKFYQQAATAHGVWQWQGSADASSWTNIGSTFTLGGAATQTITALANNQDRFRYYRILGVSGSTSNAPFVYEFEFQISEIDSNAVILQTKNGADNTGIIKLQPYGGNVTAPTMDVSDSSDHIATTAFTKQAIQAIAPKVYSIAPQLTTVGNVGAGEDNLQEITIDDDDLTSTGDILEFTMNFALAANTNSKTIKIYWGSGIIAQLPSFAGAIGGSIEFKGTIIRTGATSQKITVTYVSSLSGAETYHFYSETAEDVSGGVALKATGEAVADDDIQHRLTTAIIYKQ